MSKYYGEHTKGCQCADCVPVEEARPMKQNAVTKEKE